MVIRDDITRNMYDAYYVLESHPCTSQDITTCIGKEIYKSRIGIRILQRTKIDIMFAINYCTGVHVHIRSNYSTVSHFPSRKPYPCTDEYRTGPHGTKADQGWGKGRRWCNIFGLKKKKKSSQIFCIKEQEII
jgi:hypothetical protein